MRVLAITQIWPNSLEPLRCPFNLQQFGELAKRVDLKVLAAVAHVPGAHLVGQPLRAARLHALPPQETTHGIETHYLRQLYVPKVGVPVAVPLYLASMAPHRKLLEEADVLLGSWAYPDGCAAVLAARALGKPVVVKVHGSDLNVIAQRPSARAVLRRVLPHADAMVTVSRPLGAAIEALGVPKSRVHLVENGVDTRLFAPRDKDEARRELGLPTGVPLVVFVGRLEPQKGAGELLEAFEGVRRAIPDAHLAMIGGGEWTARVKERSAASGGRLIVPGARPLAEVARWVAAADVFTLPSWMEGTPNVVLEALASGRPVVATRVGGIPDVLADPRSGILVAPKDVASLERGLVDALHRVRRGEWDAEAVRACGPRSWAESAAHLHDVLTSVLDARRVRLAS